MEDALSLNKMIQLGLGRIRPKPNFCWGEVLRHGTLIVSRLTPPPPLEVQEMVEELRSPAGELPAETVH